MDSSTETPEQPEEQNPTASDDKTVAIVAYLTIIGFIVAIILHGKEKTPLGAFHLRQMMGLSIGMIACSLIPFIGLLAILFFMVLWIMGIISAVNGQMKPVPLLGEKFDEWFKTVF